VRGRKTAAIAALLAILTLPSLAAAPAGATECWSLFRSERLLKQETNESRVSYDRRSLPLDDELSKVARRHSQKMAAAGQAFHSGGSDFSLLTGGWNAVHENVAKVVSTGDTAVDMGRLQREFMASATHRENILRRGVDYVGVGIVRANSRYYVTVLFVDGSNPGTSLRIASC
jgi:uncharacterized protein YkwD